MSRPRRFLKSVAGRPLDHLLDGLEWISAGIGTDRYGWPSRFLPQPAVPEDLLDHLGLVPLDEGDDFHFGTAGGTANGVRAVDLFDQ